VGRRARGPARDREHHQAGPQHDWSAGLRQRFDTAGIPVDSEQLHQILYYSEGHPLRTMLICAHALDWLEDERISAETIRRAIASAERHPSWGVT
jgi:hypothetical protein